MKDDSSSEKSGGMSWYRGKMLGMEFRLDPRLFRVCGSSSSRSRDKVKDDREGSQGQPESASSSSPASPTTPVKYYSIEKDEAYAPVTRSMLQAEMEDLSSKVMLWTGQLKFRKTLQDAKRNHGRVDLVESPDGESFAVKRMPTRWVTKGHAEFEEKYPTATEKPWMDFAIVKLLNKRGFKHCCTLEAIFHDNENTYAACSLANNGDLFSWCNGPVPSGKAREELCLPIVGQIFAGVRYLHEIRIAHRDLSLENILLHEEEKGAPRVKIIDFGMATISRYVKGEVRGKQSYQAPEMHPQNVGEYDGFLTDSFALGVVLYCLNVQDYPWSSTKKGECKLWEYVSMFGLRSFMAKRKLRKSQGKTVAEALSPALVDLLEGLLHLHPQERWCLGETCWNTRSQESRDAVSKLPPIQMTPPNAVERCGSEEKCSVWNSCWMGSLAALGSPGAVDHLHSNVSRGRHTQESPPKLSPTPHLSPKCQDDPAVKSDGSR